MKFKTNFENGEWKVKEETIQFADEVSFTLSFYHLSLREITTGQTSSSSSSSSSVTKKKADEELSDDRTSLAKVEDDFESVYLHDSSSKDANRRDDQLADVADSMANQRLVNLPPKSMADLLNKTNDFQAVSSSQMPTPSIAYWFGLCKFVVLAPTRANSFIDSESRAKVILSSISVAINNTGR